MKVAAINLSAKIIGQSLHTNVRVLLVYLIAWSSLRHISIFIELLFCLLC